MDLPASAIDSKSAARAIQAERQYALAGLLLGGICIIGGIALSLFGASGSADWSLNLLGSKSRLADAR